MTQQTAQVAKAYGDPDLFVVLSKKHNVVKVCDTHEQAAEVFGIYKALRRIYESSSSCEGVVLRVAGYFGIDKEHIKE